MRLLLVWLCLASVATSDFKAWYKKAFYNRFAKNDDAAYAIVHGSNPSEEHVHATLTAKDDFGLTLTVEFDDNDPGTVICQFKHSKARVHNQLRELETNRDINKAEIYLNEVMPMRLPLDKDKTVQTTIATLNDLLSWLGREGDCHFWFDTLANHGQIDWVTANPYLFKNYKKLPAKSGPFVVNSILDLFKAWKKPETDCKVTLQDAASMFESRAYWDQKKLINMLFVFMESHCLCIQSV